MIKHKRIIRSHDDKKSILHLSGLQWYHESLEIGKTIFDLLQNVDLTNPLASLQTNTHTHTQEPRTDGYTICPLFLARYTPNSIRWGDIVIAYKSGLHDIKAFYYIGKWLYYYMHNDYKDKLFDYSSIKWAFWDHIRAKINHLSGIDFLSDTRMDFKNRYTNTIISDKQSEKPILQLYNRRGSQLYPYYWTQPVNDMYVKQLFDLYVFAKQNTSEPNQIITTMNQRMIWLKDSNHEIHLNRNSRAIYRDNNFSFGLVDQDDPHKPDILLFSFVVHKDGILDIVQIWSNHSYYQANEKQYSKDQLFLAEQFVLRAKEQWIKKIRVMRWDKIWAYKFPQQYSLREWFTLAHHQEQLRLIYNVTPVRKRWRKKTSDTEAEWYSATKELT